MLVSLNYASIQFAKWFTTAPSCGSQLHVYILRGELTDDQSRLIAEETIGGHYAPKMIILNK